MKRLVALLAVALASAAITYFLMGITRSVEGPTGPGSDITWIRTEFDLNDAQFAAVQRLHDDYSGLCAQHCADIIAARERLASLSPGDSGERAAAEHNVLALETVCNEATRAHLRRVAAAMPSAAGERFLRKVEPHLAQLPHDGTRGLGR